MKVPHPTTVDVSRRQILASTGSLVVGGAAVSMATSQRASAATNVQSLDIPPAERESEDGAVSNVTLQVSGTYQFKVNAADTLAFELSVAPEVDSADWTTLDSFEDPAGATQAQGQYTMAGSVLDHPAIASSDFDAEPEETKVTDLPVRVDFVVLQGGEEVVEAAAKTVATVEITNTSVDASATIAGSGDIGVDF